MKGRISNPQGDVMIRTDVIAKYAGSALLVWPVSA